MRPQLKSLIVHRMCAQFMIRASVKDLALKYGIQIPEDLLWNERILPFAKAPVITAQGFRLMTFSLIPSWFQASETAKRPKFATYNARIETVQEKATWKKPFLSNHCLVPMTSFIEPIYEGEWGGNMIRFNSAGIITAAGIWDRWINHATGETVESFAILTQEPCAFIKNVGHDRQPIFLKDSQSSLWASDQSRDFVQTKQSLHSITQENPVLELSIDRPLKAKKKSPAPATESN